MPEADAQDGSMAGKRADDIEGNAGLFGGARAGGKEDAVGLEGAGLGGGDLVIAKNTLVDPQLAEVLDKVEGK